MSICTGCVQQWKKVFHHSVQPRNIIHPWKETQALICCQQPEKIMLDSSQDSLNTAGEEILIYFENQVIKYVGCFAFCFVLVLDFYLGFFCVFFEGELFKPRNSLNTHKYAHRHQHFGMGEDSTSSPVALPQVLMKGPQSHVT